MKDKLFPECDFRNMLDLDCLDTMSDPDTEIKVILRDEDFEDVLEDINIEDQIGTITEKEFLKIKEENRILDEKLRDKDSYKIDGKPNIFYMMTPPLNTNE